MIKPNRIKKKLLFDMNILAIDPGNKESAWCFWNGEKIGDFGKDDNCKLKEVIQLNWRHWDIKIVVIEMVSSYGMPVGKEVFETVLYIGQLMERCKVEGVRCELVYRREVKMHLCNSMKAKDSNIRQALVDRFGDKGTKKSPGLTYGLSADVWQAFALGVYYFDTHCKEAVIVT
jgi:hypothetical protein